MNPFLERINKRNTGSAGRVSEKRVLKSLDAKPMPGSGNMSGAKSDGVLDNYRLELKSTTSETMKLDVGWLSKISREASSHGQIPALIISFVQPDGKAQMTTNSEWIMVPRNHWEEIKQ